MRRTLRADFGELGSAACGELTTGSRAVCTLVLLAPVLATLSATTEAAPLLGSGRRRKKLIATGWDKADSERLLKNHELMEKRPFDGVIMEVIGQIDEKKRCHLRRAFVDQKWQREWFQPCIDNLKACSLKRLTDNFVTVGANPGNVDWFDDEGWANIAQHWRIAAWVAKQSGFKGILFDPEPYAKPHRQFAYSAQPERARHTFDEYCAKARERGRQVMQATAAEYPDITLYTYFMNIVCSTATGHADPRRILSTHGYGLYPAFIDGWLDVVPPGVKLVDGCERAYHFNSAREYLEAALLIKGACQELVSPENRAKYRAQVQVSFGVYLDAYWNPKDSKWAAWYVDGKGGPRVDRLRANVVTALRVADEYVWIYGEKFRWWPTPNGRVREKTWPEALPGCEKALRFARDPLDYGRTEIARLKEAGRWVNLTRNGDFGSVRATTNEGAAADWKQGGCPAGWHAWQEKTSKGTFTWDRLVGKSRGGSAKAANVANGCFIQSYKVKPGEQYAVRALRKLQGRGEAWLRIRWQTPENRWTAVAHDKMIYPEGPRGRWCELFGVVEVPEGAGKLIILLLAAGQTSPQDVAWFDDVELSTVGITSR